MSSFGGGLGSAGKGVPQSVEQITRAAQEYEYDARIPLRYWLRSAQAMLQEAEIYIREGDDETTYLLLFRHAHLLLSQLPAHPDLRDKANKALFNQASKVVHQDLETLNLLKPRISERYARHVQIQKEREERRRALQPPLRNDDAYAAARPEPPVQALQAHAHKDLAVRIAQKEISRRAANRHAAASRGPEGDDVSRRLQEIRSRLDPGATSIATGPGYRIRADRASSYQYPSVPSIHGDAVTSPPPPPPPLPPPPHPPLGWRESERDAAPALPPKHAEARPGPPPRPGKVLDQPGPARSPTPEASQIFAPAAYLENGTALRTVFLPPTLRTTFLRIAYKNTLANLETCGFLGGTLIANAFFVSRLIIPAQTATSDTCEMTNESALFDYVDSEDLMILGWIHTHPTQTCFMSSRDLHTHAGYQMMLAESVAIVCAPSKGDTAHGGDWGVYRLTDPPGKKAILDCEQPGIFHPHDVDHIYTDALRPGHVVEATGMEFEIVDLRDR